MPKNQETKGQWGGRRSNQTGRPAKDPADKAVTVSLSMPGDLHRKLKDRAEADGLTVNDAIRVAVAKYVKQRI